MWMLRRTTNMTNEKVIPKDIWKQLKEYWDNTYYEELSEKKLKDILGKYVIVPIPKNITNRTEARIWYIRMSELREKGTPFGGYKWTIDEQGLNTTLGEIIGLKEPGSVVPTTITKALWNWAREKGYAPKKKE